MTETPYYDLFGEDDNEPCRYRRDWGYHFAFAPHVVTPVAKKIYPEIRQKPHCPGSDNCLCEPCRYTRLAPVLIEQQQNWERRRLIKQALNAENREMAERAAERRKLKNKSVEYRSLELD